MLFLPGIVLFVLGWVLQVNAGKTACTSTHTDWYTSVIGETPCTTYERLRRICNPSYQVGTLTRNTPPDHCDDQVQDCCCNSIAFGLSMLCLACQDKTANGFDAGKGAYEQYLKTCNPRTDQKFTDTIQKAVCNSGIKIEDSFYDRIFWSGGDWFYAFTRDFIISQHIAYNNKTQTKCIPPTPPQPPPPPPPPTTSTSSSVTSTVPATATLSGPSSGSEGNTSASSNSQISSRSISPLGTSSSQPLSASTSSSATETALTGATSSGTVSRSGDNASAVNSSQLETGSIVGIVVGVVVILILLLVIAILLLRRRRTRAIAVHPEIHANPYNPNSPGPVSSGYGPSGPVSTTYLLGDDAMATPSPFAGPVQKGDRERGHQRAHPSISNTETSVSESGSGYDSAGRHVDAGPVLGANLGRSGSGRLPPAYGEQFTPVRPMFQPEGTDVRGQAPPPETGVQDGPADVLMREVGDTPQLSMSPLIPVRRA